VSADRPPAGPARSAPGGAPAPTGRAPGDDPDLAPLDEEDPERARRLRRLATFLQAGGIAFLAVVALGLLPTIVGASYPALGARLAALVWIVAPAIPIVLLVVAAVRLRR
jgi:hypothetical protein